MTPYGVDSASKDFELLKQFSARTGVEVQADAPEAFDAATFLGDANAAKGGARAALKAAYDALRPNAPLVVCTVPLSGPPPPVSQADMDGLLAVDEDLRTTAAVLAAAGFERISLSLDFGSAVGVAYTPAGRRRTPSSAAPKTRPSSGFG